MLLSAEHQYIDLGAEQIIGAEKSQRKIAVEIKSFVGFSTIEDLQKAIGQYSLYVIALSQEEPERVVYLAVSSHVYDRVFENREGLLIREKLSMKVIVVDIVSQEVTQWRT